MVAEQHDEWAGARPLPSRPDQSGPRSPR